MSNLWFWALGLIAVTVLLMGYLNWVLQYVDKDGH
jgi:hypothetical protein